MIYDSPEQEAIVETALSYLARGSRIQYDDTRLTQGDFVSKDVRYRWQRGENSPEDCTTQYYGYSNCAAFTYDVYYEALDYDILCYTTASLIQAGGDQMPFKYYPTGEETEEEMAQVEQQFRDTLQMGDIIVVRYNGKREGNGHAMLYVGAQVLEGVLAAKNNQAEGAETTVSTMAEESFVYDIIHSTGSSYSYSTYTEKFEQDGTVQMTSVDMLFDPESSRYVFSKLISFGIVRPLLRYEGGVPEKTQNRINNLHGVVAEKLSSHTVGMTVSPGEEMTFTFSMENRNARAVTLEVKDSVPENTTYVSGAQTVEGRELSWNVTVPAGEVKTVSYTVRVNDDAPYGGVVYNDFGTVGGVDTFCSPIHIANTLNADEQQAILSAAFQHTESELRGMALANAIYTEALGTADLLPDDYDTVISSLFVNYLDVPTHFTPAESGRYIDMLVPTMYGGRYTVPAEQLFNGVRTRLPYKNQLMAGDIILAAENADATMQKVYLFAGDITYNLMDEDGVSAADSDEVLGKLLAYNRFAVLRPSMVLQK